MIKLTYILWNTVKYSNNTLSSKQRTLQITFPICMFDLDFFFLLFPMALNIMLRCGFK